MSARLRMGLLTSRAKRIVNGNPDKTGLGCRLRRNEVRIIAFGDAASRSVALRPVAMIPIPYALDALNFLAADVRNLFGPFVNVFLVTGQHWSQTDVGLVTTGSGLLGIAFQTPIGVQLLDGVGAGIYQALTPLIVSDIMRGTGRFNLAQGAVATTM